MAVTTLADVIIPEVFTAYLFEKLPEVSLLIASGIAQPNPLINEFLGGGGATVNLPFWKDLQQVDANISSDNPGSLSTPNAVTAGNQQAVRLNRNQSWGAMDLAADLAGDDPMNVVVNRVARYWVGQDQRVLNSIMDGVRADNINNDGGDMVNDISTGLISGITPANLWSAEAYLDTLQTLGDHREFIAAIGVHSVVYTQMQKENLIDYIPDSRGETMIATYMGKRVIVDDVQTVTGTGIEADPYLYVSTIYGMGSFGFGDAPAKVPTEVWRVPASGDGGGEDQLYSRRQEVLHPLGFHWNGSSVAGQSPTNAELADPVNWDRRFDRKNCPLAWLISNG